MESERTHNIKCWPEPFEAMKYGRKTAEFRLNDRDYKVGDFLLIREWCPEKQEYTHRELTRKITHVLSSGYGVPSGYAMLSLYPVESERERIVKWLRDDVALNEAESSRVIAKLYPEHRRPIARLEWDIMISTKRGIADAIERGEHMKEADRG